MSDKYLTLLWNPEDRSNC